MERYKVKKAGSEFMRILITGANRGLGFELTKLALHEGHTVFGGAYSPDGIDDLEKIKEKNRDKLEIVDLDVGSDESVTDAIKKIDARSDALDSLVNNAG